MPYIVPERRKLYDPHIVELSKDIIQSGELNYVITRLCHSFLEYHGIRYDTLNTIIGVLECAKLEAYRRIASGYEDGKALSNGDVLPHAHTEDCVKTVDGHEYYVCKQ